jgi:hypothetical protein
MNKFQEILKGGDLRSIGKANEIVRDITTQNDFDELFIGLNHSDRKVVMRTADAIEKITLEKFDYLQKHKKEIINLCQTAIDKEFKWHLALIVSRLRLTNKELGHIWDLLTEWATNKKESKIVRVNAIQGLFNLLQQKKELSQCFNVMLSEIIKEKAPSLSARIKKLQNTSR